MSHRFHLRYASAVLASVALVTFSGAHAATADEKFVEKAAIGGMTEVQAGELAKTKGNSQPVKDFGGMLVTDHQKAGDELKAIATKKSMPVPANLDKDHKKLVDKLAAKSGADFDKAFKSEMVDAHKKTIDLFEKQAKSGKDADLKDFADKTLPALKHHLEMAKALKI